MLPTTTNIAHSSSSASECSLRPMSRLEVSKILNVSIRTLENWQKSGRMPHSVDIGGRVYWHSQVFYEWLDLTLRPPANGLPACSATPMVKQPRPARPSRHLSIAEDAMSRNRGKLNKMLSGG